ncbi:malonate decarboxylase epsilon subunit [Mycolicibacterium canariasense]|uniref:[acyl-carrier-protein] S-malonyltransferase n=1 Tax=Mycolicibacterium canariasense TaxID=228230 RepID=A0A100WBB1_MYCCR|nr:acyltransferase domain-containing protein [Mycolicibacterium canariasense]MCV7209489.1 acyltransferase domain-containing protein [Mycolicibacterium canariasense]ORV05716.1 hypothetical protein AWB94_17380 [Mycolicibacterium canariasense]GAS94975.1 malonate decarboxylase epsilon subunit [Mycolicibacterium canariasense]
MNLALLFPGQGSQQPDMLHTLPASPAITATLAQSPTGIDSAAALASTANTQRALLVAGVACARALVDDYGLTPQFVAGHSAGAFAAAVTAGVLTLSEALEVVAVRGRAMEEACAGGEWGMAAVTGLPERTARQLVARIATEEDPLWVANINGATQTVVSGSTRALQRMAAAADTAGATDYRRLAVTVASHCPLQQATATELARRLADVPRRTPTAHYLTNTGGRAVLSADAVLEDLAAAVARPVCWYDAMRLLPELGVTCAVEARPGDILTRLLASTAPGIEALSLQDHSLASAAYRARGTRGPL